MWAWEVKPARKSFDPYRSLLCLLDLSSNIFFTSTQAPYYLRCELFRKLKGEIIYPTKQTTAIEHKFKTRTRQLQLHFSI